MSNVKSGSGRRPRGSLGRAVILDAAERVARSGVDRVTIRAVAAEANAAPMALYNHFASQDDLTEALLDRALGRLETPDMGEDWRADLRRFAIAHRRFLESVPWALSAYFRNPFPGPNAARVGEYGLALLARAGLDARSSFIAWSGLVALNYGAAAFILGRAEGGTSAAQRLTATLDAATYPHGVAAAAAVAEYGSDEHYETILDWYLVGLTQPHAT